jgi:xanthine dehydrogenase accessory factor
MRVFPRLLDAIDREGAAALVTVLAVEGSGPREAGARMVVRPSGGFNGTIGGGMLEWEALAEARRLLQAGRGPARSITKSLGPELAQCCGGRVALLLESFDARDRDAVAGLAALEGQGRFTVDAVRGVDGRLERRPREGDPLGGEGVAVLPDGRLIERFGEANTPLLLFGAGHVARAVVLALAPLPFDIRWIDSREDAFPAAVPANVTLVRSLSPAAELDDAPPGAFVAVMTHSHPLDLDIASRALRGGRFGYVGLIGSSTKRARFVSRMRLAGLGEADIGRLVCPIGLSEVRGKEPAIIAASLAADLLIRRQAGVEASQVVAPRRRMRA